MAAPTAAIVVIGNEILSGKITDLNAALATRELRRVGVRLERILVIPDDVDVIAAAVSEFSCQFDWVITSGGVGPTHDDVTIGAIAKGFGVGVIEHPELLDAVAATGPLTGPRRKLAEIPEGAVLVGAPGLRFPAVRVRNVFIFPGIPQLFRDKLAAVLPLLGGEPLQLKTVYLDAFESRVAAPLNNTLSAFPKLALGSYPVLDAPDYKVRITFESVDSEYVDAAVSHFVSQLSVEAIVRIE